jgi:uncharacterized membrane protein HdeD (DUF308 family)
MKTVKSSTKVLFTFFIAVANLLPIIGPALISSGLGYNIQRFSLRYDLSRKDGIIPIILGNVIFYLAIGIFFYINNFSLYAIILLFLGNLLFSFIFYHIGKKRYLKKHPFLGYIK